MQLDNGSWLFREETQETIETLFQRTLGETPVWEAQLLDGGLFNTTYLITYGAARERALLDQVKTPSLLYLDLWAGNVLLDGDSLEILAVIDSDRAVFGDPDFEFAAPWMENPALRRGYGYREITRDDPARQARWRLYRAFFLALDAYVGLGEYNNPGLFQEKKAELLALLEL